MSMAFAFSRWLLLVPLCIGIVLLVPPQVYAERRLRGQFQGSFLAFFPHFFEGVYPHGNFSWHHLWFLGHLFLYSLLALPLFRYWQHPAGKRQLARIARIAGGHFGLLWLALPLILERHLLWSIFPERHMLTSDWSNHALLFVAYLYGFVLAGTPWLGRVIDATWPSAAVFAGVTSASLVSAVWMGAVPSDIPPAYSAQYLAFWSVYAITAWTWLVAILGAGRRFIHSDVRWVQYSRWTYPVYLLHQPIVIGVAYFVVQWHIGLWPKAAVLLLAAGLATWVSSGLLLRILRTEAWLDVRTPERPR